MTVAEFNKGVDLFADAIYRFIVKNLKDEDDARDVVQDTFEKVWLKAPEVSFEKIKSYLFTTAYRLMLEKIRRRNRIVPINEEIHLLNGNEKPSFDVKNIINEAVSLLPEVQRSVVMLRDYEGYSYEEIGNITGLTESQVKVYIFRARVFLKNYIVKKENLV